MSVYEQTKIALAKAEELGGKNSLNCIAELDPTALEQAKELDARSGAEMPAFWGTPVLVKDNIDVKGMPTTAGTKALSDNYPKENFPSTCRPSKNGAYLVLNSWGTKWGENGYFWMSYEDSQVEYNTIGFTSVEDISENLVASEIIVTDIETGSTLDNGAIPKGTKIKMNVYVQATNEISGEEIEVKLRDRESDFTSLITLCPSELLTLTL